MLIGSRCLSDTFIFRWFLYGLMDCEESSHCILRFMQIAFPIPSKSTGLTVSDSRRLEHSGMLWTVLYWMRCLLHTAREGGVSRMLISFLLSVLAGIVCHYLCKITQVPDEMQEIRCRLRWQLFMPTQYHSERRRLCCQSCYQHGGWFFIENKWPAHWCLNERVCGQAADHAGSKYYLGGIPLSYAFIITSRWGFVKRYL